MRIESLSLVNQGKNKSPSHLLTTFKEDYLIKYLITAIQQSTNMSYKIPPPSSLCWFAIETVPDWHQRSYNTTQKEASVVFD